MIATITPSGTATLNCGAGQSYAIAADDCHTIADVLVDGGSVGAVSIYTFTNVQASHTIAVSFAIKTYNIIASAGTGGSISPSDVENLRRLPASVPSPSTAPSTYGSTGSASECPYSPDGTSIHSRCR